MLAVVPEPSGAFGPGGLEQANPRHAVGGDHQVVRHAARDPLQLGAGRGVNHGIRSLIPHDEALSP